MVPAFLQQIIDPYAHEARAKYEEFHAQVGGLGGVITRKLCDIEEAIRDQDWTPGHAKFYETFADLSQVWPDPAIIRVPQGTEWVLETWDAIMLAGTATVVIRANGGLRTSASVSTAGIGTTGAYLARGLHFSGGDEITFETIGMVAAEVMQVYLQFKSRPIKARKARNAGQPEIMPDRMDDSDEMLDRHSTPMVFQGHSIHGDDTGRDHNIPAPLPRIGTP